jgi:hypothetical protein
VRSTGERNSRVFLTVPRTNRLVTKRDALCYGATMLSPITRAEMLVGLATVLLGLGIPILGPAWMDRVQHADGGAVLVGRSR